MSINNYETNFRDLEQSLRAAGPEWVHDIRRAGLAKFKEIGFPTLGDEAWRFTRVKPIADNIFSPVLEYKPNGLTPDDIPRLTFDDHDCWRLAFVDGFFAPDLSSANGLPEGLRLCGLADALRESPDLVEPYLGRCVATDVRPFAALNSAFIRDGAFLFVGDDVSLKKPIHIAYVATGSGTATVSFPRNLVIVGKNSKAFVVESYVRLGDGKYWTNAVSEFFCGYNADLLHCKVQRESDTAFHIASQHADISASGRFSTGNISIGAALARNEVVSHLGGEGIDCKVEGLYLANQRQHIDNQTYIRHASPLCHSDELYKGILGGKARGVFNGTIYVDPLAQKTDAKQTNNCILLSDDARINTNPQLEIFADDVKCTHGATVGQIDKNALFYLQSRGIDASQARHMLIYAFAGEVLERLKIPKLRKCLESDLYRWLAQTKDKGAN